jgi:hypothetical protein
MTAFSSPPVRSNPTHKQQDDNDDQDNADDTNATVTEAVTIAAEAATEAAKQEDNKKDDKYESERHVRILWVKLMSIGFNRSADREALISVLPLTFIGYRDSSHKRNDPSTGG